MKCKLFPSRKTMHRKVNKPALPVGVADEADESVTIDCYVQLVGCLLFGSLDCKK